MGNDKKLIIGADVAGLEKGFKQVRKILDGLSKEGIKVSNVLKDMTVEKNHGMGKFAKSVVFSTQKMKDFRGITEDTSKVMKNVWLRTMEKEQTSMDRTSRQLERLNKLRKESADRYTREYARKPSGPLTQVWEEKTSRIDTMIAAKVAEKMSRQDALKELEPGKKGFNTEAFSQGVAASRALAGSIGAAAGQFQSIKLLPQQNLASIRGYERGLLNQFMGGDFSQLYYLGKQQNGHNTATEAYERLGGTGAGKIETSAKAVTGLLESVQGVLQMAGKGGGAGGAGGGGAVATNDIGNRAQGSSTVVTGLTNAGTAFANRGLGGPEVGEEQTFQAGVGLLGAQQPMEEATLNFIQSTAAARVAAAKALQGRHMEAWNIGRGEFGLDMGESFGVANQLSRGAGVSHGMGMMRNTLDLESRGMDRGASGQMLTQLMFANGGSDTKASAALEKVLSKAFTVGLKDARLGEEIGKATAELAVSGRGGLLGDAGAIGAMLTGGLNGKTDLFGVQQNVAGLQSFNDRMNTNPFFAAAKMEAAKNVLGGQGTHTQMLALSHATLQDLTGEGSPALNMAHISHEQRRAIASASAQTMVTAYLQRGDAAFPDLQSLNDSTDKDHDFISRIKEARDAKDKSGFERMRDQYALEMNDYYNTPMETAKGEFNLLAGFDDKAGGDKTYDRNKDEVALETIRTQQAVLAKLYDKEVEIRQPYLKALESATSAVDVISNNRADYEAFQRFMQEFMKLIDQLHGKSRYYSSSPGIPLEGPGGPPRPKH